jgi:hypothetical protein
MLRGGFPEKPKDQQPQFKTVCDVGFGAGHSALLFLRERSDVTVYSFDVGLSRHFTAAHDYLDGAYPDRLMLFAGDSAVTAKQMPAYFPNAKCDIIYIDGSQSYAGAAADIANFRPLASKEHVLVFANGAAGSEAGRAWVDAANAGTVEWEGTIYESMDRLEGDALVYGTYKL